ncbi:hypothetical protein C9I98_04665 [Photobacterium sanctipauli]|uniref:PEP-CTERM sorting domain-containing protein n=1 Tax=Photobacterium sanctipauli TaxID=1342794 RepID=A0A2T3NY79_9GAMM|nr:hypothetical protein [Photobacterium sanctipauli]PSW21245.1 hypothetical protein C9I98_04665 [Photobacterium sanctipauli]
MTIKHAFACFIFSSLLSSQTLAGPIIQGSGDNYVAWEAEIGTITDPDGDQRTFEIQNDASASGGQAIVAPRSGDQSIDDGHATYSILFNQAGTYELFVLMRGSGGCCNSLYIPPSGDFGLDLVTNNRISPNTSSGPYDWVDTRGEGNYTVDISDVGTVLEFTVGARERLTFVDRFVLWNRQDGNNPFPSDLNDLNSLRNSTIPAPGSLAIMIIALAGLYRVRTKRVI